MEKLPIKFHYVPPLKERSGDEIGYINLHTQKPSVPACDISQKTQRKNDVPEYVIDHGILNYTSFFNLLQTIKVDVIIYYNANGLRFFCISSMQSYSFYRTKCGQLRFLFCPVTFFFGRSFQVSLFFLQDGYLVIMSPRYRKLSLPVCRPFLAFFSDRFSVLT